MKTIYEYIWQNVFPNEPLNYDNLNDWIKENAEKCVTLCFEYFEKCK